MQTKIVEDFSEFEPKQIQQARRLQVWERRLWGLSGAAVMFVLLGLIEPEIMEIGPTPGIWVALMFVPLACGIYILVWPSWRSVPFNKRLNHGFGAIGIGFFTWNYLPLYLLMQNSAEDALPFLFFNALGGVVFYSIYKRLQQSPAKQADDDFFI